MRLQPCYATLEFIFILQFLNEHFNLMLNLYPTLCSDFHIMFIPLLNFFSIYPIPLITLPCPSPLQPICFSEYSPPKSNALYSDSQLPWFKIIQLPSLFSLFLELLLHKHWLLFHVVGFPNLSTTLAPFQFKFKWEFLCKFQSIRWYIQFCWSDDAPLNSLVDSITSLNVKTTKG